MECYCARPPATREEITPTAASTWDIRSALLSESGNIDQSVVSWHFEFWQVAVIRQPARETSHSIMLRALSLTNELPCPILFTSQFSAPPPESAFSSWC